jgi:nucleotide-binding universal stress UspA family protein
VGADLIVIGSRGWGGVDHHSATEVLIARASCPVLGVNERSVETDFFDPARPAPDHAARILVPIGSSPDDLGAVAHAVGLARAFGLHLTFVSIAPRRNPATAGATLERTARREEDLERRIREMVPGMAPQFTCIAVPGKPGCEIIRIATEIAADLIVMEGHHGGLFRHLFAPPTSCEVLHESPCPVWYVPVPLAVAAGSEKEVRMEKAG